jgi:hypothetical protein
MTASNIKPKQATAHDNNSEQANASSINQKTKNKTNASQSNEQLKTTKASKS